MTAKSAVDGTLRKVVLPRARVPRIKYDFSGDTGDYLPTDDRMLHFATVLGGQYSMATLWNRSSSGGTDAPLGVWPEWNKAVRTAPAREKNADGSCSLVFDGVDDFFVLPWETIPQNTGYRMVLELTPSETEGKISLFASKMLLNVSIENGVIYVSAPGVRKVSTALEVKKGFRHKVEFAHLGDRFEVAVDGRRFSAAAKLPATFISPVSFAAPVRGSGLKPFAGKLHALCVDHSCGSARQK
jgi:hypothetical protein